MSAAVQATSAASTGLSDWPGSVTRGSNASNGATSTSAQTPTQATVVTAVRRSAFWRATSARDDEPARGAATRAIGIRTIVSKNLATTAARQGTRSAYRSQTEKRSESGVTPTIADNLDAAGVGTLSRRAPVAVSALTALENHFGARKVVWVSGSES